MSMLINLNVNVMNFAKLLFAARSRNAVMVAKCPVVNAGFLPKKPSTGGGPAASSWDKVLVS